MMGLLDAGIAQGTDKVAHGYIPHYEHHLWRPDWAPIDLLEIGVNSGRSLRMWRDWLPVGSTVVGLEIDPREAYDDPPFVRTIVGDVKDYDPGPATYHVVIDDGSHVAADILAAFKILWPAVRPGGWYVIEDLAAQWDRTYSPPDQPVISWLHDTADVLAWAAVSPGGPAELHLYHQIVFLRKLGGRG